MGFAFQALNWCPPSNGLAGKYEKQRKRTATCRPRLAAGSRASGLQADALRYRIKYSCCSLYPRICQLQPLVLSQPPFYPFQRGPAPSYTESHANSKKRERLSFFRRSLGTFSQDDNRVGVTQHRFPGARVELIDYSFLSPLGLGHGGVRAPRLSLSLSLCLSFSLSHALSPVS